MYSSMGNGYINDCVVGVMKMGNIGLEPTSLALPFHQVDSLMSPLYARPPVCAAPCLRDHTMPIWYGRIKIP